MPPILPFNAFLTFEVKLKLFLPGKAHQGFLNDYSGALI